MAALPVNAEFSKDGRGVQPRPGRIAMIFNSDQEKQAALLAEFQRWESFEEDIARKMQLADSSYSDVQKYFGAHPGYANWAEARKADLDSSGEVDIFDVAAYNNKKSALGASLKSETVAHENRLREIRAAQVVVPALKPVEVVTPVVTPTPPGYVVNPYQNVEAPRPVLDPDLEPRISTILNPDGTGKPIEEAVVLAKPGIPVEVQPGPAVPDADGSGPQWLEWIKGVLAGKGFTQPVLQTTQPASTVTIVTPGVSTAATTAEGSGDDVMNSILTYVKKPVVWGLVAVVVVGLVIMRKF